MLKSVRLTVYVIGSLLISFSISSCSTFDPPTVIPVYGHIDSIHFSVPTDSLSILGSGSANIPYAWVYLDDNPVGAFQMPCTFPMVASNGTHTIQVYSGIIPVNGTSPASIYPFYQFYSVTLNLQQGNTYKIKPTSVYYIWAKFKYLESFENEHPNTSLTGIINFYGDGNASGATTTAMTLVQGKLAFQGQSGMVVVNQSHGYYIGVTNPPDSLPTLTTPVYVELNYRATTQFSIGLFEWDTNIQVQPVVIYPAPTWNKMYFNLSSTLSAFPIEPYCIYFALSLDTQDGHTSDTLLLDNIKILD